MSSRRDLSIRGAILGVLREPAQREVTQRYRVTKKTKIVFRYARGMISGAHTWEGPVHSLLPMSPSQYRWSRSCRKILTSYERRAAFPPSCKCPQPKEVRVSIQPAIVELPEHHQQAKLSQCVTQSSDRLVVKRASNLSNDVHQLSC